MEQANSQNLNQQLQKLLTSSPGIPASEAVIEFGRMILPRLGINSFTKDTASTTETNILGGTNMSETQPDETTLSGRAKSRINYESTNQQQNLEDISFNAAPFIKEDAKPSDVEDDWLSNFLDKGRLVSDKEMQKLWSHVLASEVNQPGSFSIRTVNMLASLNKKEAILFKKICSYSWADASEDTDDDSFIIINGEMIDNPSRYGLEINDFFLLQDTGLINYHNNPEEGFIVGTGENEPMIFDYHGHKFKLHDIHEEGSILPQVDKLHIGQIKLSYSGQELARICKAEPDFDYMNYIVELWKKKLHVIML